jgi:hypothetical protein
MFLTLNNGLGVVNFGGLVLSILIYNISLGEFMDAMGVRI